MRNAFKRFGARDTSSREDRFARTRLWLTLVYVAVLAVILLASGGITRVLFSQRLDHRLRDDLPKEIVMVLPADIEARRLVTSPEEVRDDLRDTVLLVNGLLLVIAAALSYVLAGLTLRPIRNAYERQRQFLGDASHELRTPLAILRADLENERERGGGEVRIDSHLEEVERMSRIVGDLLTLSRLDEDAADANERMLDLGDVAATAVERLRSIAERDGVAMTLERGATARVNANEDLLLQALTNVIKNAIQYNARGGRVDVSLSVDGPTATVRVADTGAGIAPEDLARVFDRFYRADGSRSRKTGGSGLGLSIVRSIMRRIGGSVRAESTPGTGTTVTLSFPVHNAS